MSPAYAVISCGEGNKYGHPSAQTLNNFRSRGIKTFRTDNQGTIVAYSDGSDITWNASPDTTWTPGEPKVLLLVGVQPQKRVLLRIVQVKQLLRLPQKDYSKEYYSKEYYR